MERQIQGYFEDANEEELHHFSKLLTATAYAVELIFHMPVPHSWSEYKKNMCRWGRLYPISKPDVDNLEKFYLDVANEMIWKDDAAVVSMRSKKVYSDQPKTEMIIKPMNPMTPKYTQEILQCISPADVATLSAAFENILDSFHESDINACAEALGKLSLNYSQKLNKICKIKQKWDKAEQKFLQSEIFDGLNEDENEKAE